MEAELTRFSRSLDALSGHLQNPNKEPAIDLLRNALPRYEPAGYPTDKPLPKSAVKLTLSNDLISKICNVLRLLLEPVLNLASRRPPPTNWDASMGFMAAFDMAAGVLMHLALLSQLLPVLLDSPETSRLVAQLSDESLLQSLADWSRLAEKVGWRLAEFRTDSSRSATAARPKAQTRPKAYRVRNTSYGGLSTLNFASNVTGFGGHSEVVNLVCNTSFLMNSLVEYVCKSSHASAAPRLPLLAATLHRTQLLAAVSSALRSAPALPFWGSAGPDGPVETAAMGYASGLTALSNTAYMLAEHMEGTAAAAGAVPHVLELLSDGELQRLLLEAMERVAELYEEETGMASSEAGCPHGAAAPPPPPSQPEARVGTSSGPTTRSGSPAAAGTTAGCPGSSEAGSSGGTRGPGGGWPLFDASVAPRISSDGDQAAAIQRWDVVRRTLATWRALQHHGKVAPVLPPPRRLAPLALRLNRALVTAPPPVPHDPGQQPLTPAELAKQDVGLPLNDTMLLCQALLLTLKRCGAEEVVALQPGLYEAWAWGLAAAARRFVRAIKGGAGGSSSSSSSSSAEVKGALLSAQQTLIKGQELVGKFLLDPRAGWPALSPALREDVVRRLAGAGLLRSWDTALRLAADSGYARLLGSAVSALLPSVELLMVPLLREAMRPRPLSAAAATAACPVAGAGAPAAGFPPSSLLLPPPVAVTDPWDGARELGWLVTAAKLVSQHGWELEQSSGLVHSGESSSSWGFLSLRAALQSLALGPDGLPALLTELAAEPAAVAGAPAAGAHAGTGSGGPDPRVLALLEGIALAARSVFATSHLACAESTSAVLPSTASEVTALRSATRLLPPPAVLGAEPLLPLGAAAAALRALMAKGGGGTVPNAVASAARRLAQSVVTALAELAAEPVLEPYAQSVVTALAELGCGAGPGAVRAGGAGGTGGG
ncbi:hypothetical protein GPECTOR_7g949 [Gonium pectorale]|uniref:Uncharacterized protein n=1 Tax=Gonium pectorale TaxID=33097 RepID=A0A150GUI4_GONPE|nr:hypothetical protein GPECTOR_7g949 [Gonium pectorale]|eukprot:KXZ53499.1 hypothetical protein GPECTOR_7g949 [Gonium pectorale]